MRGTGDLHSHLDLVLLELVLVVGFNAVLLIFDELLLFCVVRATGGLTDGELLFGLASDGGGFLLAVVSDKLDHAVEHL